MRGFVKKMKLLQWLDKNSKAKENWQVEVVRKSELFDERWYVRQYQDVFKKLKNLARHYCLKGWRENRNLSEKFDTDFYLHQYKDVADKRVNPLLHYIGSGKKEGRNALPKESVVSKSMVSDASDINTIKNKIRLS